MAERATFAPAVYYRDPMAALDWLATAFGFERTMLITDSEGRLAHSEMSYGAGYLMVAGEWTDSVSSPEALGRRCTQTVHVHLEDEDIDAHCERARAAGAEIRQAPADQFYGDRTYRAVDPEGHIWTFSRTVRRVSREEAEAASGLAIDGWP